MRKYKVNVKGVEREITVLSRSGSQLSFSLNGEQYDVIVEPVLEGTQQQFYTSNLAIAPTPVTPATSRANSSSAQLQAPMPGIIVNIQIQVGDQVTAGQTLLVMEAMKMENNIQAHKSGTIKKILVKKGQEVTNHQALIEIE